MDLHEKRQLDLAEHMAKVNEHMARARAHARPWRAITTLALAIVAGVTAAWAGNEFRDWTGHGHYIPKLVAAVSLGAFVLFGATAVLSLAAKAREVLTPVAGSSHAAIVRYAILLVGGVTVLILALALLKVPIGQLLLGGAVTTILLGIAGQQSLANVFAGLVLLLSRPFAVGDYIRLRSGAMGGETQGLVTEIGVTYLRIDTDNGVLNLPNSQVLAAAVGPAPRPAAEAGGESPGEPGPGGESGSGPGQSGPGPGGASPAGPGAAPAPGAALPPPAPAVGSVAATGAGITGQQPGATAAEPGHAGRPAAGGSADGRAPGDSQQPGGNSG